MHFQWMGALVAAAAAAAGWHNPYLNLMDVLLTTIHRFLLQLMQSLFPGSRGVLCHWIDTVSIY
jgi:hypothetical protein